MKRIIPVYLFLAILFFSCISKSFAQEQNDIDFKNLVHIGMEQGLSSNKVNCIFQDKKGFMWFGTDYGLNRYDGYNFKLFTRAEGDSTSLTDNNIKCLAQDTIGNIWIGTPHGLNVMDYKTGKIQAFVLKSNTKDILSKYNITALAADDSSVWIGTAGKGLFCFDINKRTLTRYIKPGNADSLNKSTINNIVVENNGAILAGLNNSVYVNGLIELNALHNKFLVISLHKKLIKQTSNSFIYSSSDAVSTIYKAQNGDIYISTLGNGSSIDPKCDTCKINIEDKWEGKLFYRKVNELNFREINLVGFKKDEKSPLHDACFVEYGSGQFFCFNYNYFISLKNRNGLSEVLKKDKIDYPWNLFLEKVFKDKSGKLWFITRNGLETLDPLNFKFNTYRNTKSISPTSIIIDRGKKVWIGSDENGIVYCDLAQNKFESFKPAKNTKFSFNISGSFNHDATYGIGNFRDIYSFDTTKNSFKKVIDLSKLIDPLYKLFEWNDLICTSDGGLWVNLYKKGIVKVNINAQSVSLLVPADTLYSGHSSNCFPYIDDGFENFYYANCGQIIQINYKKDHYNIFDISSKRLYVPGNYVSSLALDKNNNLWLSTTKTGLCCFNVSTRTFNQYEIKEGLPSNEINRIFVFDTTIWGCYSHGILKFGIAKPNDLPLKKLLVQKYTVENGLPEFFNYGINAVTSSIDHNILMTMGNLVISFNADSIKPNMYIPPVMVTSLQVNNQSIEAGDSTKILLNSISSTDSIHLKHDQNNVSLEFAALNYIHSEDNAYAYKMEGIDTAWIYCGKRKFVTYSNLDAGKYTFSVKASNNDGSWNETGTTLRIIIQPPWWKTWWAYLIYGIAFITGITMFVRFRTASLKRKQVTLEKKVQERTDELQYTQAKLLQKENAELLQKVSLVEMKAFRSQMNPHFIFNALQSIQTFLVKSQPEEANKYLVKFSKLMRAVLENSQHSEVSVDDDLKALELYMQLESIRLTHPFTYNFHIDKTVDLENDTIPPLILQPFVENAIWHGLQYKPEPGHINIYITKKDNALHAIVEDNGIGRDMGKQVAQPMLLKKESLGLKLTEERLKVLNEVKKTKAQFKITDLFTSANLPAGTRVELSLPFEV